MGDIRLAIGDRQHEAWLHRWGIMLVLLAFLALAVTYSVVTPIFEASDELWHYPVVQYIAAGRGLPVQTPPDRPGLWKQEASQPPLYYALAGLLTSWVDTRDLAVTLRPNPHAAIGVITPDGNINMAAHDPVREAWPWRGTVLAVHLARLLSVAMGAATVYLIFRLGREAFPDRLDIALAAAAFTAFTPMFIFISGSVNNDNLIVSLCALALLIMIRQSQDPLRAEQPLLSGWARLGVVIGLAALAKLSGLLLLLPAAWTGALVAWRQRSWKHLFAAGLAIGLPVLVLTGWWFWRNLRLYGDWTGLNMFNPYFTRAIPADLAQIWSERTSFLYGYWGNFGGLNLPIPVWAYVWLNGMLLVACVGLAIAVSRWIAKIARAFPKTIRHLPPDLKFPLPLITFWALMVFLAWLAWTHTTWSSQGRLVFYALPAYSILMAAGLAAWLPRRVAPFVSGGLGAGMALLSAAMPFTVIAPAYARPPQLVPSQVAAISHRADVRFGDVLVLLGYDAPTASARPGDPIPITLYWQALKPAERDYSVFVHLLGEYDIVRQDKGPSYPGRGNLPTTTLAPGQTWAETWIVPIDAMAYTPDRLVWEVGLYDAATNVRLPAADQSGRVLGDNIRFGQIELARPAGSLFSPVSFNLGDQIELIGFDLDRRAAMPGETIKLTLFWRALAAPLRDYTIFVHVLGQQQAKVAATDEQPSPPTSRWRPGQVISATYLLKLDAGAPPDVYDVQVGAYYFVSESSFERLQVLTHDGRQQQDYILLNKIRVVR